MTELSQRFSHLEQRLAQLRGHLLPPEFDATGTYDDSDRVTIHTLAFRVLAHAEIEAYFEDRIVEIAKAAWQSWRDSGYVSRVAFCLLGFCGREVKKPPETLSAPSSNKVKDWRKQIDIDDRLKVAVHEFVDLVLNLNHGVREKNLLAMLLPIGYHWGNLDATFVADIDSFGKRRGEAAHSSSSTPQVRQGLDPKAELEQVSKLIESLRVIDEELSRLLQQATRAEPDAAEAVNQRGAVLPPQTVDSQSNDNVAGGLRARPDTGHRGFPHELPVPTQTLKSGAGERDGEPPRSADSPEGNVA